MEICPLCGIEVDVLEIREPLSCSVYCAIVIDGCLDKDKVFKILSTSQLNEEVMNSHVRVV